jgi:hypothetical protein
VGWRGGGWGWGGGIGRSVGSAGERLQEEGGSRQLGPEEREHGFGGKVVPVKLLTVVEPWINVTYDVSLYLARRWSP